MGRRVRHFNMRHMGAHLLYDSKLISGPANGAALRNWVDWTGNNHMATQSIAIRKPTYLTRVQGGQAVVRFDGSSDLMEVCGSFSPYTQPLTIFVASRFDNFPIKQMYDATSASRVAAFGYTSASTNMIAMYAGTTLEAPATFTSSFSVFTMYYNDTNSTMSRNGVVIMTGSVGNNAMYGLRLCAHSTASGGLGVSDVFGGDVAYIGVAPDLDLPMRRRVEQSLVLTYKLTSYGD